MASFLKPRRGPSSRASARPLAPQLTSTTVPPAKSSAPSRCRIQPSGANTQCATGTYTSSVQTAVNATQEPNLARSAMAPLMSAAVMIAKVSWKVAKSTVGTCPVSEEGVIPAIPRWSRPPIRPQPPASRPNASE